MEKPSVIMRIKNKFIGDRAFYQSVVKLLIPIVIQQGITSFVNLLDNVMVGALSTAAISGVAIVNQLIFIFNLSIFGSLSGPGIYSAQYAGVNDYEGVRRCFRFKLIIGAVITFIAMMVLSLFGDTLIGLYLNEESNSAESLAATLSQAKDYLWVILIGLPPFMLSQAYGTTLRENGETAVPMRASIISIVTNCTLNYTLIYGHFGAPAMGVKGAAIATVIARYFEITYMLVYTYRRLDKYPYFRGAIRKLTSIPTALLKKIAVTGTPLLANEFLWSTAIAIKNQCFSYRGLDVVAATNITSTVWQVFAIIMASIGSAISIMVGQKLGAGDIKGARRIDTWLIFLSFVIHLGIGLLIAALSGVIPLIYNVEQSVRDMTSGMLVAAGCTIWINALSHASYFTIRSGGRTIITFLLDSMFTLVIVVPVAYVLCYWTSMDVTLVYACVEMTNAIKFLIALPILISGSWARNVINIEE
jgi:putative MATE family efflux protein